MWAKFVLTCDGHAVYEREVWLTASPGDWARGRRIKMVNRTTAEIKKKFERRIATSWRWEVTVNIQSTMKIADYVH